MKMAAFEAAIFIVEMSGKSQFFPSWVIFLPCLAGMRQMPVNTGFSGVFVCR